MAIRKRVVADDGLTRIEEVDLLAATYEELCELLPPGSGGWEWQVRPLERFWQQKRTARRKPLPLSEDWYAREILACIRRADAALAHPSPGSMEAVLINAKRLGELHQNAWWRFNYGSLTKSGIRSHQRQRQRVADAIAARRTRAAVGQEAIRVEADAIRQSQPYDRHAYPTSKLAQTISHKLKRPYNTVLSILRQLQIE